MNAYLLAQPQSEMTLAVMQLIRFNYDCLQAVEQAAIASSVDWSQTERLLERSNKAGRWWAVKRCC
jgi:insecticidal toxin